MVTIEITNPNTGEKLTFSPNSLVGIKVIDGDKEISNSYAQDLPEFIESRLLNLMESKAPTGNRPITPSLAHFVMTRVRYEAMRLNLDAIEK